MSCGKKDASIISPLSGNVGLCCSDCVKGGQLTLVCLLALATASRMRVGVCILDNDCIPPIVPVRDQNGRECT
jgi:hypothetical protein